LLSRKRINRIGCGLLVVLWFAFLIIGPCAVINLLINGEIVLTKSTTPDDQVRVWMISSPENRGIGFANGYVNKIEGSEVCTRTDFTFILWQGQPPVKPFSCTCYEKMGESYSAKSMDDATCQNLK
jgi:hypothetical protein